MSLLPAGYLALALALWLFASAVRRRPFSLRWGLHDFITAILVPGVGLVAGTVGLVLELMFRHPGRQGGTGDFFRRGPEDPGGPAFPDPVETIRIETSVAPFAETLTSGELEEIDRALRRLLRADSPKAIDRLKEALRSPRRDVRVRARGLLVHAEDELVRLIRGSKNPEERGRACRRLASLSVDQAAARQYLERAVAEFRAASQSDGAGMARLELAKTALLLGDPAMARDMVEWYLLRRPTDLDAYLTRLEANLKLGDVAAARRDCAALAIADPRYAELLGRWDHPADIPPRRSRGAP